MKEYEEDFLSVEQAKMLEPGDEIMFIDFRDPVNRDQVGRELHGRVCTVRHVSATPAIEVEEYPGRHFILKCSHMLTTPKGAIEDAFNEVFA